MSDWKDIIFNWSVQSNWIIWNNATQYNADTIIIWWDNKISIHQENKEQIIDELLRRKSENLGMALKELATQQKQRPLEQLIPISIQFGFDMMKADNGFFIEVLKHWHQYINSEAAQIVEQHFFEVGIYVFNQFFQHWSFEMLKNKSFVIVNSTLFTMMRYVSSNDFLIEEQKLKQELCQMILAYLKQN